MRVVERWWNGTWGRLARRDMWLIEDDAGWHVEARAGDGDAHRWRGPDCTEAEARAGMAVMLERTGDQWQRLDS